MCQELVIGMWWREFGTVVFQNKLLFFFLFCQWSGTKWLRGLGTTAFMNVVAITSKHLLVLDFIACFFLRSEARR